MTKKEVKLKKTYYLVDTAEISYGAYPTLNIAKRFAKRDPEAVSITKVEEIHTTVVKLKEDKSPWVSEQDRLEVMALSLGHELDKLANDMSFE